MIFLNLIKLLLPPFINIPYVQSVEIVISNVSNNLHEQYLLEEKLSVILVNRYEVDSHAFLKF